MKRFAVIGLGHFGFHAAKALYEEGTEVVAVDRDRDKVQAIAPHCTEAVMLDARDKEALNALGLENMDGVLVSTGKVIATSILVCLHLQETGVKRILTTAVNEDHEKILKRVGATEIIHPDRDMALRVSRSLASPNILDFIPLGDEFDLIEVVPPGEFLGKTLKELDLRARYKVSVIAIKERGTENLILVPPPDVILTPSDILIMLGKTEDIRKIKVLK